MYLHPDGSAQSFSFQIAGDTFPGSSDNFPDLRSRRSWYNLPLLTVKNDVTKAIKYQEQRKTVAKALKAARIQCLAVTHVGRKTGARFAEQAGVPVEEVARAGHWAHGVMEEVYLQKLSRPALRGLAGFSPGGGNYYLARDVDVPTALQRKVFPGLEKWQATILSMWASSADRIQGA